MRRTMSAMAAAMFAAGSVWAACTGNEALNAKCSNGKVKAKLTGAEPGSTATFQLDGDPNTNISVTVDEDGTAKAKWKGTAEGAHTVSYLECGLSADVEC